MKRIVVALVFFAALIAAWQYAFTARIWSPVWCRRPVRWRFFSGTTRSIPALPGRRIPTSGSLFLAIGIT